MNNKYILPFYEPMQEIGETQEQIDLVNHDCKNIYLGVWQGVLDLCYDLFEYQVEHGIDTEYIEEEQQKVWSAIYQAMEEELLDDEDIEILRPHKLEWIRLLADHYENKDNNKGE